MSERFGVRKLDFDTRRAARLAVEDVAEAPLDAPAALPEDGADRGASDAA